MTPKFKDRDYVIDGNALNSLWRIYIRLNDGTKLDANERRDLAQRIAAIIEANAVEMS